MAQKAQAHLPIGHDGAAAGRIAPLAGERGGNAVLHDTIGSCQLLRRKRTRPRQNEGGQGHGAPGHVPGHVRSAAQPKTSPVMVLNHPSANNASWARTERGASVGLTPPAPCTSVSTPLLGT